MQFFVRCRTSGVEVAAALPCLAYHIEDHSVNYIVSLCRVFGCFIINIMLSSQCVMAQYALLICFDCFAPTRFALNVLFKIS